MQCLYIYNEFYSIYAQSWYKTTFSQQYMEAPSGVIPTTVMRVVWRDVQTWGLHGQGKMYKYKLLPYNIQICIILIIKYLFYDVGVIVIVRKV